MYFQTLDGQTVAQLLLRFLQLEGVRTLFGIPGGALKNLLNELAIQKDDFQFIVCRHETGAAYMAEGYSRLSGLPGVVMVTSGPGSTNALTGVMNSHADRHPMLLITGEVPEQYWGKGYLQEGIDADVDVNAIYTAGTMFSAIVTHPNNFQQLFSMALREALSLPQQAVHLSLPDDIAGTQPYVLSTSTPPTPQYVVQFPVSPSNYRTVPASSDPAATKAALASLLGAKLPVILLGNGCRSALRDPKRLDRLVRFAKKFQIPIATTPDAKGLFPESDALSLRSYGMAGSAWSISVLDGPTHDAVLVVASALGELATNTWNTQLVPQNGGPLIQVDLDQHAIARVFPISSGIVAEAGLFLDDLCRYGEEQTLSPALQQSIANRFEMLTELKLNEPAIDSPGQYDSDDAPIKPPRIMKILNDTLPSGSNIFVDAGNCVGWAANYLRVDPPSTVHFALGMGPMGWSVACVIGAKLAAPDSPCIAITGDGSFLMHGVEISTAAAHRVGAIWIVLQDDDLGMVTQGMEYFYPNMPGHFEGLYSLGNADLHKFAESLGADAQSISSPAEMQSALELALKRAETQKKPQVIVAHVDSTILPPYYTRKNQPIPL